MLQIVGSVLLVAIGAGVLLLTRSAEHAGSDSMWIGGRMGMPWFFLRPDGSLRKGFKPVAIVLVAVALLLLWLIP
jgi:hypothetical protein